jgi:DNA repair exonuclease SbcCD nuclease subunit
MNNMIESKLKIVLILFVGDPHFKISNISETDIFIEKITFLARQKNPTIIIVAGDLLHNHERLHTIPLNKSYSLINKLRNIAKTYILVGNHDMINHQQFLTTNHWMNGMKEWDNTIIVDKVLCETINMFKFIFVPFVAPGRFEEALNTLEDCWKDSDCIFAHQEFFGCKMGAIISSEGDKWSLDYPEVVSGHIHSNQQPQKNIYYPGSAMQHAFGESSKNIIALLFFDQVGEKYKLEEIDLKLPRKKIIYSSVEDIEDLIIPETQDKIKISVTGVYDQFKSLKKTKKYKDLVKKGIKVVFRVKEIKETEEKAVSQSISFNNILEETITKKKDKYLYQTYQLVVKNKVVNIKK